MTSNPPSLDEVVRLLRSAARGIQMAGEGLRRALGVTGAVRDFLQ